MSLQIGNMMIAGLFGLVCIALVAYDSRHAWRGRQRRELDRRPRTPAIVEEFVEPPLEAAEVGFALPAWLARRNCPGCGREQEPGFLCPTCDQIAGRRRVHSVFLLLEQGRDGQAWGLSNALVKDVRKFRRQHAHN